MQYPYISVSLQKKELSLVIAPQKLLTFPVAIGKKGSPTPKGTWQVVNKKILTTPSVFGSHWLGLNNPGYGIHGTNHSESISQAVSGGCIRMHNKDILFVFSQVSIGTIVRISD